MKILAVNLLRLGDIMMVSNTLFGLRRKYPDAELHVLINKEFEQMKDLLPFVDRFHYFDRKVIQSSLGEADRCLFEAYDRIKDLTTRLNELHFDLLVNLSQNKLSGYLVGCIEAKEKLGLSLKADGVSSFGSPWFRYLNRSTDENYTGMFHYSDIHYFGSGLTAPQSSYVLKSSSNYKFETTAQGPVIFIQAFSAEAIKMWSWSAWKILIEALFEAHPNADVRILAAPSEKQQAQEFVDCCKSANRHIEVLSLSIADTLAALQSAKLLISVDTSIKHLAAATNCKIVELAIGKSEPQLTGSYSANSLILSDREGSISPASAAELTIHFLNDADEDLSQCAFKAGHGLKVQRSRFTNDGIWYLHAVNENCADTTRKLLSLWAWKFVNNCEHHKQLATFGTEAIRLRDEIGNVFDNESESELAALEEELRKKDFALLRASNELRRITKLDQKKHMDWSAVILPIEAYTEVSEALTSFCLDYDEMGLYGIRQIQTLLTDCSSHTQVQLSILKAYRNFIPEVLA